MKSILAAGLLSSFSVFSQSIHGEVTEAGSGEALSYASIGIVGHNVGTVSDAEGRFTLVLDGRPDTETVRVSALGYDALELPVGEFRQRYTKGATIALKRNVSELREVTVRSFAHRAVWGNTDINYRDRITAGFVNNKLGNQLGMVFKAKKKPVKITGFHAIIANNQYREIKFRLNVYAVKDGLPAESLLAENIIVSSSVKKGRLDVDLEDYGIVAEGDFYVSLEWIEDLGEGGLHFAADYSGPKMVTRAASQGLWNPQQDVSFAFSVSVRY